MRKLPDPGPVALLGTTLEIQAFAPTGEELAYKWDPPGMPLYWSPNERMLFTLDAAPKAWSSDIPKRGLASACRVFRRWTMEPATRYGEMEIEEVPLVEHGRAVHIVYRSDKWRAVRDYIHHFGRGVFLYVDSLRRPDVFVIRGGRLTVTERGLVN